MVIKMKIAVIGAGAMGSIYGCHLSKHNEVYLIDTKKELIDKVNQDGVILQENGEDITYHPIGACDASKIGKVDLIILFVKSLFSRAALNSNKELIGENTYIMTLQNGGGHEDLLAEFVPKERVIIGTTEDNGAMLDLGYVRHGGNGKTNIGMLTEDSDGFLIKLKDTFNECGFITVIHKNIHELIWAKLFTNVSLSVLTGILQVKIGFIAKDQYAWAMTQQLVKEAVAVASGLGLEFDEEEVLKKVKDVSINSPDGTTSIYADISCGRKTEVDTISGYVVKASRQCGVPAPTHELMVSIVHAMENRNI